MEVKTDQVFLVQGKDKNIKLKPVVVISNNAVDAKLLFDQHYPAYDFVGITSFVDYLNVQKNILSSLNGDENAWPLIVDQANIDKNGI